MESRTGTATASMVVGIVAVAGEWLSFIPWFVGLVLGIVAICLAANGLKACPDGKPGHGMAVAGLVLGIVAVGLTGVFALCMCVGLPLGLAGFAALL